VNAALAPTRVVGHRRTMRRCLMSAALLLATAPATAADPVKLDPAAARRLGVVVAPAEAAAAAPALARRALATVIDAGPLLTAIEDVVALDETARASSEQARRLQALFNGNQDVSRQAAVSAAATAAADAARARAARGRLAIDWSPALARPGRGLTGLIASGRARLVRVEGAPRPLSNGAALRLVRVDGRRVRARVIGPASGVAVQVPGPAWLAIAYDATLSTGEPMTADVAAPAAAGALLPPGAVLLTGGRYVYFTPAPGGFEQHMLPASARATAQGWAVPGLAPGARVVVGGTGALLAAARTGGEDKPKGKDE
jgi:hypothetical protein